MAFFEFFELICPIRWTHCFKCYKISNKVRKLKVENVILNNNTFFEQEEEWWTSRRVSSVMQEKFILTRNKFSLIWKVRHKYKCVRFKFEKRPIWRENVMWYTGMLASIWKDGRLGWPEWQTRSKELDSVCRRHPVPLHCATYTLFIQTHLLLLCCIVC